MKREMITLVFLSVALCILIVLMLGLSGCTPHPQPVEVKPPGPPPVYEDEYVIKPKRRFMGLVSPKRSYVKQVDGEVFYITRSGEHLLIKKHNAEPATVPYDANKDRCFTTFAGAKCDPNWHYKQNTEPLEQQQWGILEYPGLNVQKINGETPDIRVAVIDTGVNCDHEDIECDGQYDAIRDASEQQDDNGHGTHVAGTIGAVGRNGKGVTGVTRGTRIGAAKFLTAKGGGSLFHAMRAMRWAIDNNYDIINNSWGGGGYSRNMQDLVTEATDKGIIVVAAAGNSSLNTDKYPHYPSGYNGVISVAAIDSSGNLASYSNHGARSVDIAAPGSQVLSCDYRGGYMPLSGTSMATPHVSGLLALMLQQGNTPAQATKKLYSSARKELTGKTVYGVADGAKALEGKQCSEKQCKKCLKRCTTDNKCNCKKWRKCRAECRENTGCGIGCKL